MNAFIASLLSVSILLGSGLSTVEPQDVTKMIVAQNPEAEEKPNAPAWRPENPSDVLVMVQAFYDGTKDLEAKFKQTYWNPTYGEKKDTSGKLKLKKPGKMVWDYSDGEDADYFANGDTLWMVEHDTRQVIKTSI